MPKTFYQTDVVQDGNIWTSSVTYSETIEEHEHAVLIELANDWAREGLVVPEFDQEAWESEGVFEDVLESINADGSTLTVEALAALAKMKLIDVNGLDIDAIVAGGQPVKLAPVTSTVRVHYGAYDGRHGTDCFASTSRIEFEEWLLAASGHYDRDDYLDWRKSAPDGEDSVDDFLQRKRGLLETWSTDTFDIAVNETAAVACLRSIEAGFGKEVDEDDDICGSDAVDWLTWIIGDVRKALATPPKPVDVAVILEGGLVQHAVLRGGEARVIVVDYDVEGTEPEKLTAIPGGADGEQTAIVSHPHVGPANAGDAFWQTVTSS